MTADDLIELIRDEAERMDAKELRAVESYLRQLWKFKDMNDGMNDDRDDAREKRRHATRDEG